MKYIYGILLLLLFASCVTTIPLNEGFYNQKKVGVIFQIDSASVARSGSQGLIDMALTPGNRYKQSLKLISDDLKIQDSLGKKIESIFKLKNKSYQFIKTNIVYDSLENFVGERNSKKVCKKDFRYLKTQNNVDEILFVKLNYGMEIMYYGFIETGKMSFSNMKIQIINLEDNSLMYQDQIRTVSNLNSKWDDNNFENLKTSLNKVLDESMVIFRNVFFAEKQEGNNVIE